MRTATQSLPRIVLLLTLLTFGFIAGCDYSIVEGGRTGNSGNDSNSTGPISITLDPFAITLGPGASQQFTATVTGTTNKGVSWSIVSGRGTLSSTGLFTAPSDVLSTETTTIEASAQADPTQTTRAIITLSNPDLVCFERDVMPIFASNCTMSGCHSGNNPAGDLDFTTYEGILAGFEDDDPDENNNHILKKITEEDSKDRMPPPPMDPLSSEQINTIRKWIQQGAKNEECAETGTCDTMAVSYAAFIQPLIVNTCKGCHNGANAGNKNVNLMAYDDVKSVALSGQLLGAVSHAPGFSAMPRVGSEAKKLDDCTIAKIRSWIRDGAPNN